MQEHSMIEFSMISRYQPKCFITFQRSLCLCHQGRIQRFDAVWDGCVLGARLERGAAEIKASVDPKNRLVNSGF